MRLDYHIVVCPSHYEELYMSKGKELPSLEFKEPYQCFYCVIRKQRT
jgi:hypothetical protein